MYFLCDQSLYKTSGYIDIHKIDESAWPDLAAVLSAGDRAFQLLHLVGFYEVFPPF
jgi:hypothetical protein